MIDQLRSTSLQAEQLLNTLADPIKPYLSHIGRFLLVVTFIEDALRIFMQWTEQARYMEYYRSFPVPLAHLFLLYNISMMAAGSFMVLARFRTPMACTMLASVVVVQTFGYGLFFQGGFMLRNFSIIGGLLLLLADSINVTGKKNFLIPGLPDISETEKSTYVALFGRVLLILLFGALALQGSLSVFKVIFMGFSMVSCLMVAVGFKARHSAMLLVAVLSIANIVLNPWWTYHWESPERDFLRYDFFQMLSIMGGFLLLANSGPGEISIDEKKKHF